MGLAVSANATHSIMTLAFMCDMPRCSNIDRFTADAAKGKGFIEAYAEAMKAGWLERFGDRLPEFRAFLCPSCSGKEPQSGKSQEEADTV